jgi:Excalibur calcium-binding domain
MIKRKILGGLYMRKSLPIIISFGLVLGITSISTEAAPKVKTYKNCTELNKAYKGGVARAANVKNKGGKTKYKPYVSKALYDANKKSDRDKDLIACER